MRFRFSRAPRDPSHVSRPLVSLDIEGVPEPVTFLIDTGAVPNRLPRDWAIEAGIDLTDRQTQHCGLGGDPSLLCHLVEDVQVTLGAVSLSLAIWFCDDWSPPFGLLGQEGFLQYFTLKMSVAEEWFELVEADQIRT